MVAKEINYQVGWCVPYITEVILSCLGKWNENFFFPIYIFPFFPHILVLIKFLFFYGKLSRCFCYLVYKIVYIFPYFHFHISQFDILLFRIFYYISCS